MTRFGIIRHAETVWNREKRIQGQSDSPLTAAGQAQAEAWGRFLRRFPWDAILASDTGRAAATVAIINAHLGLPVASDPRLRELDWGRWTGFTVAEIRRREPQLVARQEARGWDFEPPGGESRRAQLERSRRALLEAADGGPGRRILVVTHGGTIKTLVHHLKGTRYTARDALSVDARHLHWVADEGGALTLIAVAPLPPGG
jgi:probable phosphoglycerate mutase